MMSAADNIRQRLARPDGVRRIAQALWMTVGEPLQPSRLLWARGHLGPQGDELLWQALLEERCLEGEQCLLEAHMLSAFLCKLWRDDDAGSIAGSLVWTLPDALRVAGVDADGYLLEASRLVSRANKRLLIVSPYLEPKGIGRLHAPLLGAMGRGVNVTIIAHGVADLASLASAALEPLRRESRGSPGDLRVYSALVLAAV